uniref:Uncharacterized protein n=1 Tax=Octactis speculum TaxID=3111310 RepID=A0A7S2E262_9STRA|mmetsp:Transcript_57498/g.78411  ORF Transcript_57498/g.78411 Transcript_57498/m.78411 type:complete len:323 (+) Transcript_57498:73-1041(+)
MDFHVGMSVGNLTTVFQALHQGGQEYFFVGADSGENAYYDLFVEIPGTGAILEFSSLVCNLPEGYAISAWDICQQGSVTSYLEGERANKIKSIPGGARSADDVSVDPTPEGMMTSQDGVGGGVGAFGSCSCDGCDASAICWRKTTFASAHAFFGLFFAIEYLGASWTRMGHPGVNIERCATIAWGTFQNGYELHFVDGSSYQSGPMTLDEFAHDLDATRSTTMANGTYDQFMDNHLTLWVDDLDPFLALYDEQDVPFLLRTWSSSTEGGQQVEGDDTHTDSSSPPLKAIILNFPSNGFVVELLSNKGATGRDAPGWDFCSAQ